MSQGMQAASRSWKRQKLASPLEPPERASPVTPWLQSRKTNFGLLTSGIIREYICAVLSH